MADTEKLKTIGALIVGAQKDLGISDELIATALGMSESSYRHKRPHPEQFRLGDLMKIFDILCIPFLLLTMKGEQ